MMIATGNAGRDRLLCHRRIDMTAEKKYWFPAKTYGWGWGLPICWQGWLVLLLFVVAAVAGRLFLFPDGGTAPLAHLLYMGFWCVLLLAVCWLKGEPPGWRRRR
jgi:hypothetical protein